MHFDRKKKKGGKSVAFNYDRHNISTLTCLLPYHVPLPHIERRIAQEVSVQPQTRRLSAGIFVLLEVEEFNLILLLHNDYDCHNNDN